MSRILHIDEIAKRLGIKRVSLAVYLSRNARDGAPRAVEPGYYDIDALDKYRAARAARPRQKRRMTANDVESTPQDRPDITPDNSAASVSNEPPSDAAEVEESHVRDEAPTARSDTDVARQDEALVVAAPAKSDKQSGTRSALGIAAGAVVGAAVLGGVLAFLKYGVKRP